MMTRSRTSRILTIAALAVCCLASQADARTVLKSICRVKGQEELSLQGMGLVVGLKGSGDGGNFTPMGTVMTFRTRFINRSDASAS